MTDTFKALCDDFQRETDRRGCIWPEEYIKNLSEAEFMALGADNVEKLYDKLHCLFWLRYGGVDAKESDWESLAISGQVRALVGYKNTVYKIHKRNLWITLKRAVIGGKIWKALTK